VYPCRLLCAEYRQVGPDPNPAAHPLLNAFRAVRTGTNSTANNTGPIDESRLAQLVCCNPHTMEVIRICFIAGTGRAFVCSQAIIKHSPSALPRSTSAADGPGDRGGGPPPGRFGASELAFTWISPRPATALPRTKRRCPAGAVAVGTSSRKSWSRIRSAGRILHVACGRRPGGIGPKASTLVHHVLCALGLQRDVIVFAVECQRKTKDLDRSRDGTDRLETSKRCSSSK
jgi:hypothetical protein